MTHLRLERDRLHDVLVGRLREIGADQRAATSVVVAGSHGVRAVSCEGSASPAWAVAALPTSAAMITPRAITCTPTRADRRSSRATTS